VGLREIPVARDALQLALGLAARMAVGAEVAAAEPALVGTTGSGTKVRVGVDGAPAASGEGDHGWRRPGRLGACISPLLTGLA
jgi:hypothetical protein